MNSDQLRAACDCCDYMGAFALDELPNNPTKFIVNTDTGNLPGQHWIAVNGNSVFDPTGYYYPASLVKHLYKYYDSLIFNYDSYQNPLDNTCGLFCLYYLHFRTIDLLPYSFAYNTRIVSSFSCV